MSIKGFALPLPQEEVITEISGVQLKGEDGSVMPFSDGFSLASKSKIDDEKKGCNLLRMPVSNNEEWKCLFKNSIDDDFILTVDLSKARDKTKRDHALRNPIGNNEQWSALEADMKNQ